MSRVRVTAALGLIAGFSTFSVVGLHDYAAWARTRWTALDNLVKIDGIDPRQIDGGYEFNGWFSYDAKYEISPGKSWWWVLDDDYLVASGPVPGFEEVRRYEFDRWLPRSRASILVLKKEAMRGSQR